MSTNLMEDRLSQMIEKLQEELNKVEEQRADIRRQIGMLNFIRTGDDDAAQELIRTMQSKGKRALSASAREKMSLAQKARHAKNNAMNARWTDQDDKTIVHTIKSKGKIAGPEAARILLLKFGNVRSKGAIRQRIARLAESGVLKQSLNGKGDGTPHMMVEAV